MGLLEYERRWSQRRQAGRPMRPALSRRVLWMVLMGMAGAFVLFVNAVFVQLQASERALRASASLLETNELLAERLWRVATAESTVKRGIVLPLFDDIATLGVSLVLELRAMGVHLPVEVPHCGDLSAKYYDKLLEEDKDVRVYDVCELATTKHAPLFCVDLEDCHSLFRSFNIKVLAVILSKFQEVMVLDADTLFFQNPMTLWSIPKYTATGTLFFHDRISYEQSYLAKRVDGRERVSRMHVFLSSFDVSPYRRLAALPRASSPLTRLSPFNFSFTPSAFLMKSHSWSLRAGHQMDSSLVLWNKLRQPRATAILASFIARTGLPPPPSYGDKEYYFLACELAETAYSFSEHAVGTIGTQLSPAKKLNDKLVLCGDALHFYPEPTDSRDQEPRVLYINSDSILTWQPQDADLRFYRTKARPAYEYPGSFETVDLPQTCPFNVQLTGLTASEVEKMAKRQDLHLVAQQWTAERAPVEAAKSWRSFFH
ncbi:hypothetical protein Poli38472_007832 [Pythium oligandrum]|uniref:Nucleotide-diphospho-sugar transferase domain-containing protein n=1 Tax=Pythium oligandrum TaxID=41045 RepID=A0A8K1FLE5_PYTOL|nr:hypothetical protein Poli38472_007832 [Pythium oligandrum]|eukprot:TMW68160.1 hypothetical protein Poli38472_007832 [Pythium oligandrum]